MSRPDNLNALIRLIVFNDTFSNKWVVIGWNGNDVIQLDSCDTKQAALMEANEILNLYKLQIQIEIEDPTVTREFENTCRVRSCLNCGINSIQWFLVQVPAL